MSGKKCLQNNALKICWKTFSKLVYKCSSLITLSRGILQVMQQFYTNAVVSLCCSPQMHSFCKDALNYCTCLIASQGKYATQLLLHVDRSRSILIKQKYVCLSVSLSVCLFVLFLSIDAKTIRCLEV